MSARAASEVAKDTIMHKISLDLSLGHAQDGTASNQQAPPLETANSVGSAMRVSKRKRGRPRKHDPGAAMPLATIPAAPHPAGLPRGVGLVSPQAPPALPLPLLPAPPSANAAQRVNKRRVRAPSSTTNKQRRKVTAAGSGVIGVNPEVITVQAGENIARKVMSFSGNGWAVCILSAHGAVSDVTLCQGTSFHETTTYEGHFEILSLSGSFQPLETDGMSSRTGGLSVSLAALDGRVFGGGVAGALTAALPVQVVIGRFPVEEKKKLKRVVTSGFPGASSSTPRVL